MLKRTHKLALHWK